MRATLIPVLGLLLAVSVPAHSQDVTHRAVLALDGVAAARHELLNDTAPFARCPVEAAVGEAFGEVRRTRHIAARLEPRSASCGPADRLPKPDQTRLVTLDSLALGDSTGTVHVTVQRGDLVFRERHELRWLSVPSRWMVERVIVGGAEHHSYIRRPPAAADPSD